MASPTNRGRVGDDGAILTCSTARAAQRWRATNRAVTVRERFLEAAVRTTRREPSPALVPGTMPPAADRAGYRPRPEVRRFAPGWLQSDGLACNRKGPT